MLFTLFIQKRNESDLLWKISGYIGLMNNNLNTTAKSLYISGGELPETLDLSLIHQCAVSSPTTDPTITTPIPIDIIIDYVYTIKYPSNTDLTQVAQMLFNITDELLLIEINNVSSTECVKYSIDMDQTNINLTAAIVHATMFACDNSHKQQLRQQFDERMQIDLDHILKQVDIKIIIEVETY